MESQMNELKIENIKLKAEIDVLKAKFEAMELKIEILNQKTNNNKIEEKSQKKVKKSKYDAILEFKLKNNKKEILKDKILSTMNKGMNLSELKFLFVEHENYCSKATFYNYLKELEIENKVEIKREKSKNFVFNTSLVSNQNTNINLVNR